MSTMNDGPPVASSSRGKALAAGVLLVIGSQFAGVAAAKHQDSAKPVVSDEELEKWTKDFHRRDANKDERVTLAEHIGARTGEQRQIARDAFFRWDSDEDGELSLSEFIARGNAAEMSVHNRFRQLDLDDDAQLAEDEFMRTKIGSQWEKAGRDNFKKFDLNGDEKLNVREFAITPALKPDPETMFRGLDSDESGDLSRDEFLALTKQNQNRGAHREFYLRDRDENDRLDIAEYLVGVDELPDKPLDPFKLLDVDGDGALTLDEFDARKLPVVDDEVAKQRYETVAIKREERFLAADQDGDGRLTSDEFASVDAPIGTSDEELAEPVGAGGIAGGDETSADDFSPFVTVILVVDLLLAIFIVVWWVQRRSAKAL